VRPYPDESLNSGDDRITYRPRSRIADFSHDDSFAYLRLLRISGEFPAFRQSARFVMLAVT